MKKFLKDNRGVSLVELVVVIAIMMVLGGTATYSYRLVSNKTANQCAENMKISLEKNKTSVMGKKNGRIAFFTDADGFVYMQEDFDYTDAFTIDWSRATKIGTRYVSVTVNGTELGITPVVFEFSRNGGLKDGSGNLPIVVSRNATRLTLTIDSLTGKVTLK